MSSLMTRTSQLIFRWSSACPRSDRNGSDKHSSFLLRILTFAYSLENYRPIKPIVILL